MAHDLGIISITQKKDNIIITFKQNAKVNPAKIPKLIQHHHNDYYLQLLSNLILLIDYFVNNKRKLSDRLRIYYKS